MDIHYRPTIEKDEMVIVVDTADHQQLPGINLTKFALIDHHKNNSLLEEAVAYYHEDEDSTCQLVYNLLKAMSFTFTKEIALALAAGILGDTIYLEQAHSGSIIQLGEILTVGQITYKDVLNVMRNSGKLTRETKLEAALNARLYKVGEYLLVFTKTKANLVYYVAMMFIELGADIALVSYQDGEEVHIRLVKAPDIQDHRLNLLEIVKKGIEKSTIKNLWGDENFVGFKGVDKDLNIIKKILYNMAKI